MDEKLKDSKRLQDEAKKLADVLWAGRDDDTARLLREGVKAMAERDFLLVKSTRSCPECGGLDSMLARCFRCGATYGGKDMSEAAEKPEPMVELKVRGPHGETQFQVPREALEGSAVMEEMRRHDEALATKAKAVTGAEEKALADFTGALEEVRGKLCTATKMPEDTPWERLVPAVEAMNHLLQEVSEARDEMVRRYDRVKADLTRTGSELDCAVAQIEEAQKERDREREARVVACDERDRAKAHAESFDALRDRHEKAAAERDAQIIALRVLADQVIEADKVLRSIMGSPDPGGEPRYASDFVEQTRVIKTWVEDRSVAYGKQREAWEEAEGKLRATIDNLEEEMIAIRQGDAGQAHEWKGTYWTLAARLGVPREMMGQAKNPNADGIMKYVGNVVVPALEVEKRLEAVEKHIEGQQAEAPAEPDSAAEVLKKARMIECEHCGTSYPDGVQFCPRCGKD